MLIKTKTKSKQITVRISLYLSLHLPTLLIRNCITFATLMKVLTRILLNSRKNMITA